MTPKNNYSPESSEKAPLDKAIEYLTDAMDKKMLASCIIGGPTTKKTLFLQELSEKIELLGFPSHNIQLTRIEHGYYDKYRTYITKIVDKIAGTITDLEGEGSSETTTGDSDESSTEASGDGSNPIEQMMSGLGEIFKNIMPQMGNMSDLMKNLGGANTDLFDTMKTQTPKNDDDQEDQTKKINLEWDDFTEDQESNDNESEDAEEEDLDEENEESSESNEESLESNEESPEVNSEEIQENISDMVDMLKDKLGPMMQNLTGMFGKLFEGMKDLSIDGEGKTNNEEGEEEEESESLESDTEDFKEDTEDDNAEGTDTEDRINEDEEGSNTDSDDWDIKIHRDDASSKVKHTKNHPTERISNGSFTDDQRNLISKKLQTEEMSVFMETIIAKIIELSQKSNPLVVFIDDLDRGDEYVFYVIERLLMQHKDIPLMLVGGYTTTQIGERGDENKNLRLLLTKFKIEKLGKVIKLNADD
jgi:hypothetical protein